MLVIVNSIMVSRLGSYLSRISFLDFKWVDLRSKFYFPWRGWNLVYLGFFISSCLFLALAWHSEFIPWFLPILAAINFIRVISLFLADWILRDQAQAGAKATSLLALFLTFWLLILLLLLVSLLYGRAIAIDYCRLDSCSQAELARVHIGFGLLLLGGLSFQFFLGARLLIWLKKKINQISGSFYLYHDPLFRPVKVEQSERKTGQLFGSKRIYLGLIILSGITYLILFQVGASQIVDPIQV